MLYIFFLFFLNLSNKHSFFSWGREEGRGGGQVSGGYILQVSGGYILQVSGGYIRPGPTGRFSEKKWLIVTFSDGFICPNQPHSPTQQGREKECLKQTNQIH